MVSLLLSLIIAFTGISRTNDAALMHLAQQRAGEISHDFDHRYLVELDDGNWSAWGEVIGYNRFYSDPAQEIVTAWMNSPEHRAILTDPSYTDIGCGHVLVGDTHYFVCILGTSGQRQPDDQPLPQPDGPRISSTDQPSTPTTDVPDTAMEAPR